MGSLKKLILGTVVFGLMLVGCATPKEWIPYGGSKSDAIVKLGYEYREFEAPVIPEGQALKVATERCRAWGYTGAEPFGGAMKTCLDHDSVSCTRYRVTTEYQCTKE